MALERFRDTAGAEAAFRRSIELSPRFYDGHVRLGTLLLNQGRTDSAQVYFERAVQIDPTHPDARQGLQMIRNKKVR